VVLLVSGLVDFPRRFSFSSFTGLGYATVLCLLAAISVFLLHGTFPRATMRPLWPLFLFITWGATSFVLHRPTVAGVQNLLVPLAFTLLVAAVADGCRRQPDLPSYVGRLLTWATAFASTVYLGTVLLTGPGSELVFGSSSYALFALAGVSWLFAAWRTGSKASGAVGLAVVAIIAVSLSRMGIAAAIILLPAAWFTPRSIRGWLRLLVGLAVAGGLFYVAITHYEPLGDRFLRGPKTLTVYGIAVNGNGRQGFWALTVQSWERSPLIGNGAGSAEEVISRQFPNVGHPHNEYLRILHDYGLIGLALWLIGHISLALGAWARYKRAEQAGDPGRRVHLAAFLALAGLAMGMLTDNSWVYSFVMMPVGVLVGASVGVSRMWESASGGTSAPEAGAREAERPRRNGHQTLSLPLRARPAFRPALQPSSQSRGDPWEVDSFWEQTAGRT